MQDILLRVGIAFDKEVAVDEFSLGNPDLDYDQNTERLYVTSVRDLDAFGRKLGYKKGDQLVKLNGGEIKIENLKETIGNYYSGLKEGEAVKIEVARPKKFNKKKYTTKTLTALAQKIRKVRKNQISIVEDLSNKQKNTLKAWVGI